MEENTSGLVRNSRQSPCTLRYQRRVHGDCLEFLTSPEVFSSIVSLILSVSYEISVHYSDNYVLELCGKHSHSRYIEETLITLINKPKPGQIHKYIQFAIDILRSPDTCEKFFFINDINILLETLTRDIDSTESKELRLKFLELIFLILKWPSYLSFKHKWEDTRSILEDISSNTDVDEATIAKSEEILAYMRSLDPVESS
eukprot:TRINITY_DN9658_c0_g1_i8.p1 TRINITY_DN9658_c0_g1~~TRINITY_DN9658_c0_g1_i8.p1  ORF type:complete len:201 (+),score=24.64 TRINITY_DN9658_c0_g1_i8:610-1212(+)